MTNMLFRFLLLLTIGIGGWSAQHPDGAQPTRVAETEVAQTAETKALPTATQRDRFIAVDGPDMKSRLETAIKLGRGNSSSSKFWTAYSFDVRPGVAVDAEVIGIDGSRTFVQSANVSTGAPAETRNLGVFLLHESGSTAIARVEVYNLERRHEYSGYPVYWLG